MTFKICLCLEVIVVFHLGMAPGIVLLQEGCGYEELRALLALEEFLLLLGWKLEKILVSRQSLLLKLEFLLQCLVLLALLLNCGPYLCGLGVRVLVVKVKTRGQCL